MSIPTIFWAFAITLGYTYLTYPLSILLLASLKNSKIRYQKYYPRISLVLAAYSGGG